MKRLYISVGLLVLVCAISVLTLLNMNTDTDELISYMDKMNAAYVSKDMDTCRALSNRFPDLFKEKAQTFSLFLHHNNLSAIEEVAVTLPVILEQKDTSHFPTELARCRALLERLEDLEKPTLKNIF